MGKMIQLSSSKVTVELTVSFDADVKFYGIEPGMTLSLQELQTIFAAVVATSGSRAFNNLVTKIERLGVTVDQKQKSDPNFVDTIKLW